MSIAYSPEVDRQLKAVPARTELAKILKLRAVEVAVRAGLSQAQIAATIGVTQPEVSRLAKAARLTPAVCERGPREVLLEHAAGILDHGGMMDELERWCYTFGHTDPTGEVYLPGTWDQVERAGDLISDEDYQRLFVTAAAQRVGGRE